MSMIAKVVVYKCRNCGGQNIVKNGHNASGSQQYLCKDCGKRGVLEADEMWSFVQKKWSKRWICTVMCRRTRQIVALVIGDRSETVCRLLWEQILPAYKGCRSYSDFWNANQLVFPVETHECVGKRSGQTNHMERWYCTLRQSCARFVRKTLSFSKSDAMHEIITRLFIIRYNLLLIT
jgi:IS1 family transposase/DNA-directed RNA polymerase subunit RPC12/RpoP